MKLTDKYTETMFTFTLTEDDVYSLEFYCRNYYEKAIDDYYEGFLTYRELDGARKMANVFREVMGLCPIKDAIFGEENE